MLQLQTSTEKYWVEDFEITQSDIEFINNLFLEEETPIRTPDLIKRLIDFRIDTEVKSFEKISAKGDFYQPNGKYEVGAQLVFPAFEFAQGTVQNKRAGQNPAYGPFDVLEVEFADGHTRELASGLAIDHALNNANGDGFSLDELRTSSDRIYSRYKRHLTAIIVDALREDDDMLFIAKRWFLKSLLIEVNIAHMHLAEAVLDMEGGGPLQTEFIADAVDFGKNENPILRKVSFDYGMLQDERFDEVGPAGQVMWYLRRMEPPEILETPRPLRYKPVSYNPDILTPQMLHLESLIDDERSEYVLIDEDELEDEATITVTYPHWRAGTLPLSQRAEHLFPIAYRTPRIRMTLVDAKTGDEMQGWVVREEGYVYGLAEFYERHHIPVGGYIIVSPDPSDESKVIIDFHDYKARQEWLWIATPDEQRLRFAEGQVTIGAEFDDMITLGVSDIEALDALSQRYQNRSIADILREVTHELAQFSPQKHVHAKTLYSAVNLLRRCPPAPIFATLLRDPDFAETGGDYWRLI